MYNYSWKRTTLWDIIVKMIKALAGVLLCLVVFTGGKNMEVHDESKVLNDFQRFLTVVNSGEYDNNRARIPDHIRIWSFEVCGGESHYLYGKTGAYTFQGYTSESNLMGEMKWEFSGHPGIPLCLWLQVAGFTGSLACAAYLFISRVIFRTHSLREFLGLEERKRYNCRLWRVVQRKSLHMG